MNSNVGHSSLDLSGHTYGKPYENTAGAVYIVLIVMYFGCLVYGIALIWHFRDKPAIRIRGIYCITATVLSTYACLTSLLVSYPLSEWFKCGSQFWLMSTLLPLSLAIFQASNIRFLHAVKMQQDIPRHPEGVSFMDLDESSSSLRKWYKDLDLIKQVCLWIGLGFGLQSITTLFLFLRSKKFMPSAGVFGQVGSPSECRRGCEWVPSIFWLVFWTWVVGPVILIKSRSIKDAHHWCLQIRLCVAASLPGTPFWLAFLYSNSKIAEIVNSLFLPAMWFAPGLLVMQITSVAIPIYEVFRQRSFAPSFSPSTAPSTSSAIEMTNRPCHSVTRNLTIIDNISSLSALEFQIAHDVDPLLRFAGTFELSAENIIFLREVRNFKRDWQRLSASNPSGLVELGEAGRKKMYRAAAKIFFELVEFRTAKQPINIGSRIYDQLAKMFHGLSFEQPEEHKSDMDARSKSRRSFTLEQVAPWLSQRLSTNWFTGDFTAPCKDAPKNCLVISENPTHAQDNAHLSRILLIPPQRACATAEVAAAILPPKRVVASSGSPTIDFYKILPAVPETFCSAVFDDAEKSIKYLVYTNTWSKFVATVASKTANCTNSSHSSQPDESWSFSTSSSSGLTRLSSRKLSIRNLHTVAANSNASMSTPLHPTPVLAQNRNVSLDEFLATTGPQGAAIQTQSRVPIISPSATVSRGSNRSISLAEFLATTVPPDRKLPQVKNSEEASKKSCTACHRHDSPESSFIHDANYLV